MIKQFEISTSVQKQLGDYLAANQTDLKTAMADETRNGEVAAIIHAGLPMMVRKIYSLEKMKNFFWTKKELMVEFVAMRLAAAKRKTPRKNVNPSGPSKKKTERSSENRQQGFQTTFIIVKSLYNTAH
mgnify:CR=1 FL=1